MKTIKGFLYLDILLALIAVVVLTLFLLKQFGESEDSKPSVVKKYTQPKIAEEAVNSAVNAAKQTDANLQKLKNKVDTK